MAEQALDDLGDIVVLGVDLACRSDLTIEFIWPGERFTYEVPEPPAFDFNDKVLIAPLIRWCCNDAISGAEPGRPIHRRGRFKANARTCRRGTKR